MTWAALGVVLVGVAAGAETNVTRVASTGELAQVAREIGAGRFAEGQAKLDSLSGVRTGAAGRELQALVRSQTELTEQVQAEQMKVYTANVKRLCNAVERARWRERLLDASVGYEVGAGVAVEDPDPNWAIEALKKQTEEEYRKDIRKDWLAALAELVVAQEMAERLALEDNVSVEIRLEIISEALALGREMEAKEEWMEAYSQVYYYLGELDKGNREYEELNRKLLRRVLITAMYAPDPNEVGVSWWERRKGITDEIVDDSLDVLSQWYVEEMDFRQMALYGLENCQLFADTAKLAETFGQLNDQAKLGEFKQALAELTGKVKSVDQRSFNQHALLSFYGGVQHINDGTLGLPQEVVRAEFADGMYEALDNRTYVAWPGDVAEFHKDMTSEYSGVGIVINKVGGKLTVDSLFEEAPAYRAGLDAGDTIVAIDGESTEKITLQMAVRRITGKQGTDVILTIDRAGFEEPRDFTVTRDRIVVKTVRGLYRDAGGGWQYFADPNERIAYVRLTGFAGETHKSLRTTLNDLKEKGMRGLILDLRNNGGGYLSSAVEVVDDFVDKGTIVTTQGRSSRLSETETAHRRRTFDAELPMVVLINSYSASASEIVSGSLKDHGRALVIGTRSFGKGNVQQIQQLRPSTAELKLTIAYYYLPSGRRVHRDPKDRLKKDYGVEPHLEMEVVGEHVVEMYKTRREAGILHLNGYTEGESKWKIYSADEMLASDAQLNLAVMCLRGSLLAGELEETERLAADD